ncbi:hypothetical protein BJY52DRAFT_1233038, partial [Lactarius psammicola]
MPPVQAPVDSQSLFADNDLVILSCAILSLLFIFIFAYTVFLAWRSIARLRRVYGNALRRATTSPVLHSPRARKVRKKTLFSPIVSALVVQSTLVASHPVRLGIVPDNFCPSSTVHYSKDIPSHGPELLSRGRANIAQISLAASTSNGDGSRLSNTIWLLLATLRELPKRRFSDLIAGSARKSAEAHRHAPGDILPTKATGELDLDVLEPDTVDIPDIFLSTDDAQFETGTLPIPLIILSLPSSEHLVEDPSPDGTFRSSGRPARVA